MNPLQVLPAVLNRSRSSSNAASSRERSATLASTSTAYTTYTNGTMSTLTPSEASIANGGANGLGIGVNGGASFGREGALPPGQAGGGGNGGGMLNTQAGPPPTSAPPPVPSMSSTLSGGSLQSSSSNSIGTLAGNTIVNVNINANAGINTAASTPPSAALSGGSSIRREPPMKPTIDMGDVLKYSGGSGRGVPTTGKETGQNPDTIYKTIQEASAKRISSLDYLKKTHEPRVFWFNTLLYTQPDIAKMPSFSQPRLARRATNFLLLGVSLPSVVDFHTNSPIEYLRALDSLLIEFEDYEKTHPSDGSTTGSLSRARLPYFLKRSGTIGGKRRASSAANIGMPIQISDNQELQSLLAQNGTPGGGGVTPGGLSGPIPPLPTGGILPPANSEVIPGGELAAGEDFSWLRTPSIPFEPDFFEVFVTLCDMLIECYSRITSLVSSPSVCGPETGDIFTKADNRIRRVVFEGIIKEFVEQTRAGVKQEVAGIGKIILGGLM